MHSHLPFSTIQFLYTLAYILLAFLLLCKITRLERHLIKFVYLSPGLLWILRVITKDEQGLGKGKGPGIEGISGGQELLVQTAQETVYRKWLPLS